MWLDRMKSLKEDASDLFANVCLLLVRVIGAEKVEERVAEVVGMSVGVAKLVYHCADEIISRFRV